jgi:Protein of unknown function (DUF5132)
MPTIDDLLKNEVARGAAIGLGVATAAAFLLPAVRPVARAMLKTGILCFERGRELVAEAGETFEDLVAEMKADMAAERLGVAAAAEKAEQTVAAEAASDH